MWTTINYGIMDIRIVVARSVNDGVVHMPIDYASKPTGVGI